MDDSEYPATLSDLPSRAVGRTLMTAAEFTRLARSLFERLFDALVDAARCDHAMLLLLIGYAATWTLYASIAQSSQDLPPDMTELLSWSSDLSLGYLKHPPLAAWLVRLWFSVFPLTDWSYYLLAMLMPAIALWVVWRLSADYLEIEKRVMAGALSIQRCAHAGSAPPIRDVRRRERVRLLSFRSSLARSARRRRTRGRRDPHRGCAARRRSRRPKTAAHRSCAPRLRAAPEEPCQRGVSAARP